MASPLGFDGSMTVSFQVKDMKRTAKWYEDVLGLKLEYEIPTIGWCEVRTEVDRVFFGFSQVESPQSGAGPVPVLGVKDIDAARAMMEKKDVRFDGPTRVIPGMVKLATFFDPDGHALMLHQSLKAS